MSWPAFGISIRLINGVEMGKKMAESVHTAMQQGGDAQFDTSTNQLLQHIKLLS